MIYAETLVEELVLRGDHIVVIVLREFRAEGVTGLARFSVADVVGQDDVVARDVEQPPGANSTPAKTGFSKPRELPLVP